MPCHFIYFYIETHASALVLDKKGLYMCLDLGNGAEAQKNRGCYLGIHGYRITKRANEQSGVSEFV